MTFTDREEAGRMLGEKLKKMKIPDPVVFGVARGGVITAKAVSDVLSTPLFALAVRKLGTPHNPELGFGAIAPSDTKVIDHNMIARLGITGEEIDEVLEKEKKELKRRLERYKIEENPKIDVQKMTAILVDDGIATGITTIAAIRYLKSMNFKQIIVAVPVAAADTKKIIENEADKFVFLDAPENFWAVGQFYIDFPQTTDEEVIKIISS